MYLPKFSFKGRIRHKGIQLVLIKSWNSPKLVAIESHKSPICHSIYPYLSQEKKVMNHAL